MESGVNGMESNMRMVNAGKRVWVMRFLVASFPIVFLIILEGIFRLSGVGVDPAADPEKKWENPHVDFDSELSLFPEWDEQISRPKADDVFRIFVLGGSSAAGFGADQAFFEMLKSKIQSNFPDVKWELINGGVGAAGSHRVFEVLKRAASFSPDLVIFYLGHNEFLEKIFFDPTGLLARVEATGAAIRQIQVVNWLRDSLAADVKAPSLKGKKPRLKGRFLGSMNFPLIKDATQYQNKLQFLESNLRQMASFSRSRGFPIVLIPAEMNLMHFPGSPTTPKNFEEIKKQWYSLEGAIENEVSQQDWPAARKSLDEILKLDETNAKMLFFSGLTWHGLNERGKAHRDLRLAVLHDKHGDRSNSDIHTVIEKVAREEKVDFLDLRGIFDKENDREFDRMKETGIFDMTIGPVGLKLFTDHCHPSEMGHKMIADSLYPLLLEKNLLSQSR